MGVTPTMNRSAKEGVRSSRHYGDEGVSILPSDQGVCGRHGAEEHGVTLRDLIGGLLPREQQGRPAYKPRGEVAAGGR